MWKYLLKHLVKHWCMIGTRYLVAPFLFCVKVKPCPWKRQRSVFVVASNFMGPLVSSLLGFCFLLIRGEQQERDPRQENRVMETGHVRKGPLISLDVEMHLQQAGLVRDGGGLILWPQIYLFVIPVSCEI